ncbi:hypothetical protein T4D_2101 [Trichinella pseudospiralis]|uniref:Uncharacterized protein n=1 Tax=Trichinella pseudospiralis TaxID=6337 RepID=A0A0V1FXD4_TRIPS|nr:hypothetical protein T4D_2101 [Trichinella pseudospiralis]
MLIRSSNSSTTSTSSSGGGVALLLFRVELNCLDAGRLGQTKLDEANSDVMRLVSFGQPKRDRNPDVNSPQCAHDQSTHGQAELNNARHNPTNQSRKSKENTNPSCRVGRHVGHETHPPDDTGHSRNDNCCSTLY